MSDAWAEVSTRAPCEICGKGDWCARSDDGAHRCQRPPKTTPAGWRVVKDTGNGVIYRREDEPSGRSSSSRTTKTKAPPRDRSDEAARCVKAMTSKRLSAFAAKLRVTPESLRLIDVGWDAVKRAYTFPEKNASGMIVGVLRRNAKTGKKQMPKGHHRGLVVPNNLAKLPDPVLLTEGATDVAACLLLNIAAVGRPSCSAGADHLAELLEDRVIIVIAEFDPKANGTWPGLQGAKSVARKIAEKRGQPVRWALLPDSTKDVRTWVNNKAPADEEARVALGQELLEILEATASADTGKTRQEEPKREAGPATILLRLAASADLFHDPERRAYATVTVGDHRQTLAIKGREFKLWIAGRFYHQTKRAASAAALQDALGAVEGRAIFDAPEYPVHVRIAGVDGVIWLDLCDDKWQAIEITAAGWRVVADPPVRFRRPRGMMPLPAPARGGSIESLREFVNVSGAGDFALLVGFIQGALQPNGPYPILETSGSEDSAKSTTSKVVRRLVDPNVSDLRAVPSDIRDLMISAINAWTIVYDNVSGLAPWLSDALCRLSTGGGLSVRELYSDADEVILEAQRPVILNGITDIATRPDLLDRTIRLTLPSITDKSRRTEGEFWPAFQQARPGILGALLDAVSAGLRNLPSTKLANPPRLADFARLVVAAEPALPWREGTFLAAYRANQGSAHEVALESSAIATVFEAWFFDNHGTIAWQGTATELLQLLNEHAGYEYDQVQQAWPPRDREPLKKRPRRWPTLPNVLSGMLRRIVKSLRTVGIDVQFDREGKGRKRLITIREDDSVESMANSSSAPAASSADRAGGSANGDSGPAERAVEDADGRSPHTGGRSEADDGGRWADDDFGETVRPETPTRVGKTVGRTMADGETPTSRGER